MSDAANVKLLCLDADGVMTDGSIRIDDHAVETKRFHVRDGTGIRIWLRLGYDVAIITGRSGMALRHRADELAVSYVFQGVADKGECFRHLLERLGLLASEAAMLADDLPDLPLLRLCGYPMAVADAVPEVRRVAAFTTARPGGGGAVREAIEHLLKARDQWNEAVDLFDG
jgi:3-deoxy-D-manno-octulosonate 8-phosphate phosphatase (KDO 8-P phosphatase)